MATKELTRFIDKLGGTKTILRPHQLEGLEFLEQCWKDGHGCILADEMGLGKTCQASAWLFYLASESEKFRGLVVCPLSVLDHWEHEPSKFGFDLHLRVYRGEKDEREELRQELIRTRKSWKTILTTYELLMNDVDFFGRFEWTAVVVDEAHRLKNMDSLLHEIVSNRIRYQWILLLTGTPVQNNLNELYSLLSLCHPDEFPAETLKRFVARFSDTKNAKAMEKLQLVLKRYVLRRTKDVVCDDLPSKSEVILFHNLTNTQKEIYKAILMKNYDIFDQGSVDRSKQRLMNTLIQLRKCVGHPYLFDGIEPEPFEQGEHLVEASGKLLILDVLLSFLKKRGHKVLLFSQMTRMLDVVQDYLTYRDYSYERLDGSVRGEERFAAVQRFVSTETFCFLLSTRAGGLGLNLMAADTVIFLDSDFNPQNDLQAAARAHRIGQKRHVKVIRLVGRKTVEEIILARAASKLKFTSAVLQEKSEDFAKVLSASEIGEMLLFGLSEMAKHQQKAGDVTDVELEKILGESENGHWLAPMDAEVKDWVNDVELKNIYTFEGKDYREEAKQADRGAFDSLRRSAVEAASSTSYVESLRNAASAVSNPSQKKVYTEKEMEERRERRQEALERRRLAAEEDRKKKEADKKSRLIKLWDDNGYKSSKLPDADGEDELESSGLDVSSDADTGEPEEESTREPIFVIGDVTKPELRQQHKNLDALFVHCVDDSGSWGKGGVFTALSSLSKEIESHYELAKEMKDLSVGDVHLIKINRDRSIDGDMYAALIVAQSHKNRSTIRLDAVESGLRKIGVYAADHHCTVHLPRIGYGLGSFNWYAAERLVRKLLCHRGVPAYIYYFPRRQQRKRRRLVDDDDDDAESNDGKKENTPSTLDEDDQSDDGQSTAVVSKKARLGQRPHRLDDDSDDSTDQSPKFFDGYDFHFGDGVPKDDVPRLRRYVIAYGGQWSDGDQDATHVVVSGRPKEPTHGKPEVSLQWLDRCIKAKKLLPVD